MAVRLAISSLSNAASSNCASLNVEKVAVRPCMVAMKRCWLTMVSRDVAVSGLPDEIQALLRLAPHRVERIVPQQKNRDGVVHAVAGVGQIPRFDCGAKGRLIEIERGRDRLRPESSDPDRMVDLRPVGDEAMFLDKVTGKLGETIALADSGETPGRAQSPNSHRHARTRRTSRAAC